MTALQPIPAPPTVNEEMLGHLRSTWWGIVADARADGLLTAEMVRLAGVASEPSVMPDSRLLPQFPGLDDPEAEVLVEATWIAWLVAAIDEGQAGRLTRGQVAVLDDPAMGWRALPAAGWLVSAAAGGWGVR